MCNCCSSNGGSSDATLAAFTLIINHLNHLESMMATEAEQLNALSAKFDDLVADVRAALAALVAQRDNLSVEGQAALDALVAKVDAFDAEVGDADGSDTPPPEPTPEPTA